MSDVREDLLPLEVCRRKLLPHSLLRDSAEWQVEKRRF